MQAYSAQLQRLKQALDVNSDNAFSQYLDISQGSVSGAKKRRQIPHSWFFQVSEKTGVSLDWLFSGRGPMRPGNAAQEPLEETGHAEIQQQPCPRCARLEARLDALEEERRELSVENRKLWKENGELREKCARLEHLDEPIMGRAKSP